MRAGLPGPIENSAVFAGFGAKALGDRIRASGSRLVFTADVTYRKATIEDEGSVEEARHAWQQMRDNLDSKLPAHVVEPAVVK